MHRSNSRLVPHSIPDNSSWFYHRNSIRSPDNDIWWAVQIIKLLFMHNFPLSSYLVYLKPKYLPQHPILQAQQPVFLPECRIPSFTPVWKKRKNYHSCILIFILLTNKLGKKLYTKWWETFPEFNIQLISSREQFRYLGLSKHCDLSRSFEGFIAYLYVVIFSCILLSGHKYTLSSLCIFF